VNQTDPTDQNPDSTGCGMAFISWLLAKKYDLGEITKQWFRSGILERSRSSTPN